MQGKINSASPSAVGAVHQADVERREHRRSRLKGEDLPEPHDGRAGHQQQALLQSHTFAPGMEKYCCLIIIQVLD